MPEITFNVMKEIPTSLMSEEEKNKLVLETNIAAETSEPNTNIMQSEIVKADDFIEESVDLSKKMNEADVADDISSICSEESYTHKKFGQKNMFMDPELINISAA